MVRIACKDAAEASCIVGNLLAELTPPCHQCQDPVHVALVLTGTTPTGEAVTARVYPDGVVEIEGADELVEEIKERGCPHG